MRAKILWYIALAVGASHAQTVQAAEAGALGQDLNASLDTNISSLDALYRDLHMHPELSAQEQRTAQVLATAMRKLNLEVTEHIGGNGVVAVLRNGPGPTVLIRTEMDALPMREKTDLPFASQAQVPYKGATTYVAHSCGHDVHMAWWVATAENLLALRSRWKGTVLFVAQPAEEAVGGAHAMIEDGIFRRFPKPAFGFAAHVGNSLSGSIDIKAGAVTSNADTIRILFHGRGAHGSMPSESIDPIVMGSHFVTDVQAVVSREKDAAQFGVVTVGAFQSGSAPNIIPDEARLALTLRSFTPDVRAKLIDGVRRTAKAVATMANAPAPDIEATESANAVVNHVALSRQVGAFLIAAGQDGVTEIPETAPGFSASEDYSAFVEASGMRSVYFGIGGYDQAVLDGFKKRGMAAPSNHSPDFAPAYETAIRTGARALTLATIAVLGDGKGT